MDNSEYIAIASVGIALSAFFLAIWQGLENRKHNILSVKPLFQLDKSHLNGLHYTFESHGLGPGIIESFTILVNGKKYENPISDPYHEIFNSLGVSGIDYEFHIPSIGSSHSPEIKRTLLTVVFSDASTNRDVLNKIDKSIGFDIKYKSIYGNETFTCIGGEHT